MKKFLPLFVILGLFLIAGCSEDNNPADLSNDYVKLEMKLNSLPDTVAKFSVYLKGSFSIPDTSVITVIDSIPMGDSVQVVERDSTVIELKEVGNLKVADITQSQANSSITYDLSNTQFEAPGLGLAYFTQICNITKVDTPNYVFLSGSFRAESADLSSLSDNVTNMGTQTVYTAKATWMLQIDD